MSANFERGISAFKEVIDTPVASFFSSCVHCGLCAEACLFYTETGDPKYTPIHKLEPLRRTWQREYTLLGKLGGLLGLVKPVTDEELAEWSTLVYDSCTLCGRCSMVCPVGNDITVMIRKMREGMSAAGHAPEGLVTATQRSITSGSPAGVKWVTVQAQIKRMQKQFGIEIPVNLENADYLVLMSSWRSSTIRNTWAPWAASSMPPAPPGPWPTTPTRPPTAASRLAPRTWRGCWWAVSSPPPSG